jgi:hypothetical protein
MQPPAQHEEQRVVPAALHAEPRKADLHAERSLVQAAHHAERRLAPAAVLQAPSLCVAPDAAVAATRSPLLQSLLRHLTPPRRPRLLYTLVPAASSPNRWSCRVQATVFVVEERPPEAPRQKQAAAAVVETGQGRGEGNARALRVGVGVLVEEGSRGVAL